MVRASQLAMVLSFLAFVASIVVFWGPQWIPPAPHQVTCAVPVHKVERAFTTETLFGRIWSRPGLSLRERQMITLAVLITVDADRGSMNHLRWAHNVGITETEMREIIIQTMFYAGWPKGAHAMARFAKILAEPGNGYRAPAAGQQGEKA